MAGDQPLFSPLLALDEPDVGACKASSLLGPHASKPWPESVKVFTGAGWLLSKPLSLIFLIFSKTIGMGFYFCFALGHKAAAPQPQQRFSEEGRP